MSAVLRHFKIYRKNGEYVCNVDIEIKIDDGTGDLVLQEDEE